MDEQFDSAKNIDVKSEKIENSNDLNDRLKMNEDYFELVDNFTGMSVIIPSNWIALNREAINKVEMPNILFIIYSDTNTQIEAVYNGKCTYDEFNKIYKLNIDNMKNSEIKIISETNLYASLKSGRKEFKQAVVDVPNGNDVFRILYLFTIINNNFVSFSTIVDNNIDVDDIEKFNGQKSVLDLMNVIFSVVELKTIPQNVIKNYNGELPKLGEIEEIDEDIPCSIVNNFDYSNVIPKLENIEKIVQHCFNLYNQFKDRCNLEEERNRQFKSEYKKYDYKEMFSAGCSIIVNGKDYKTIIYKDLPNFLSAVNNGNITNVSYLDILLCLDYRKGNGNNLIEHKNRFEIKFRPYDITFTRKSDFNEIMMNDIEDNINELMKSFNSVNTIFN